MSISETIKSNLNAALKGKREFEVGVLRFLNASLHNKEIEKRGKPGSRISAYPDKVGIKTQLAEISLPSKGLQPELSDEEIIEVLHKEAKKRKEAIEIYAKGGRNDLAQKETQELEIIQKYLPEQLSEKEIEKVVKAVIEKIGAKDAKGFGRAMGEVMKELSAVGGKGNADAKIVSEIIRKQLQES